MFCFKTSVSFLVMPRIALPLRVASPNVLPMMAVGELTDRVLEPE